MTSSTDPNSIQCLDHGFVRLVEGMGNDASIVQAARVPSRKGAQKSPSQHPPHFFLI